MTESFTNQGIKISGFHRGTVLQHLESGKCKVFVPGIYPPDCATKPDNLPDAEQAAPLFGGINSGNGMFSYPNIGAVVWVFFENEDQNLPVYFAATLGGENATASVDGGFPSIRPFVSPSDVPQNDTTKNGEDSQEHMVNCGDSRIVLRESGQVEVTCRKPDGSGQSKIFINEDGSVQIDTTQDVQIHAPAITIEADDQLQLKTDSLMMKASHEIQINTPQLVSVNENSATIKSPSINMDASQGKFMARGQKHSPIYAQ